MHLYLHDATHVPLDPHGWSANPPGLLQASWEPGYSSWLEAQQAQLDAVTD